MRIHIVITVLWDNLKKWWKSRKRDQVTVPAPKFDATLNKEELKLMYTTYGDFARHYHNLVWAAILLGSTLATAGIVMFRDVSNPAYTLVGIVVLLIIYLSHQLVEGNRVQWADSKEVQNQIEGIWGVRDIEENPRSPLSKASNSDSCWRVQFSHQVLSLVLVLITIIAVVAKWIGLFDASCTNQACKCI